MATHCARVHGPKENAYKKKEEDRVVELLESAGYVHTTNNLDVPPAMHFCREQRHSFSCIADPPKTYARIDATLTLANGLILMLEVDERQHKPDQTAVRNDPVRMLNVQKSIESTAPFTPGRVFLRYNPCAYTVNGVSEAISKKTRERRLLSHIADIGQLTVLPMPGTMEVHYAFFDRRLDDRAVPAICHHPEYAAALVPMVKCVCLDPVDGE